MELSAKRFESPSQPFCEIEVLRTATENVSRNRAKKGFADSLRSMVTDENGRRYIEVLRLLQELRATSDISEHKKLLKTVDPEIFNLDPGFLLDEFVPALHELKVRLFCMDHDCADIYQLMFITKTEGNDNFFGNGPFGASGLMNPAEKQRLTKIAEDAARPGFKIMEIGSAAGWGSTPILASIAKANNGEMWCVDIFEHPKNYVRTVFDFSLKYFGTSDFVHVLQGTSREKAQMFEDGYFDLIFIDGDHSYKGLSTDLECWESKVHGGGTLCGHDSVGYAKDFPSDQLKARMNIEASGPLTWVRNGKTEEVRVHAGVIAALHERYGRDFDLDPQYKEKPVRSVWSRIAR